MGADISVELVAGKLNRVGYEAFILALRQAKQRATATSSSAIGSSSFCRRTGPTSP